jgi:CcmD family protein
MTIETGLLAAFAAYALIWVLLGGYMFFIDRRARRLERELDAVRRQLGVAGDE